MGKRFRAKNSSSKSKNSEGGGRSIELDTKYTRKAIETYGDIELDEVDAFHASKDKIFLDDQDDEDADYDDPNRYQDEVFALGVDEDDDYEQEYDDENGDEGEDDDYTWGGKRQNYYDGEEVEEEEDAKLEEEEATKLQRKRIANLKESDFLDQTPGLLAGKAIVKDDEEDLKLVQNLDSLLNKFVSLPKVKRQSLKPKEMFSLLEKEYPEIPDLLDQLQEFWQFVHTTMSPLAQRIQALDQEILSKVPILIHFYVKYETYLSYLINVVFYFHLKAKGTQHLQDHPVIEALVQLTSILNRLDEAEEEIDLNVMVKETLATIEQGTYEFDAVDKLVDQVSHELDVEGNNEQASEVEDIEQVTDDEFDDKDDDDFSDLPEDLQEDGIFESSDLEDAVEPTFAELKRSLTKSQAKHSNLPKIKSSDYQDAEYLDLDEATDKANKKHTLRHHAALIHQSAVKRTRQVKLAGDADIPYKNRDHGKQKGPVNKAINTEANDADIFDDDEILPELNEAKEPKSKKPKTLTLAEQKQRLESWATFNPDEQETGNKRQASYRILANKGLAPRRKKEQRNPRVKHRKKFETATKKLGSTKRLFKQQTAGYGGELTGIKTHLTRSTKFN